MKRLRTTGDYELSMIGLGCSKFGSLRGASRREADLVVGRALELGVTVFDTAASYGQGDSERMLGRMLRERRDVCIITKVGKISPTSARLIRPIKPLVRRLVHRSTVADSLAKTARGDSLPTSFEPGFLRRELEGCLRRLRTERIPMVMLHSASREVLERGDAIAVIAEAAERGEVEIVGASVDSFQAADAALLDSRIGAIQLPVSDSASEFNAWCERAREAGKLVVAREVLRGIGRVPSDSRSEFVREAIRQVIVEGRADVCLVGTTNPVHLAEAVDAVA